MNPERRRRLVQGVEMNAVDLAIQEVPTLFRRPVDTNIADRLVVTVFGPLDGTKKWSGEHGAGGKR